MRVPNAERAIADIRKLRDYCLSLSHPTGRHKARVFASALGMTSADAELLRDLALHAVQQNDAQPGLMDEYGQRYLVDFVVEWKGKRAMVRSTWIVEPDSSVPKLTSCYVL